MVLGLMKNRTFKRTAWYVAMVGATNVGLVELLDFDLVQWLTSTLGMSGVAMFLYIVIGLAGLLHLLDEVM